MLGFLWERLSSLDDAIRAWKGSPTIKGGAGNLEQVLQAWSERMLLPTRVLRKILHCALAPAAFWRQGPATVEPPN